MFKPRKQGTKTSIAATTGIKCNLAERGLHLLGKHMKEDAQLGSYTSKLSPLRGTVEAHGWRICFNKFEYVR